MIALIIFKKKERTHYHQHQFRKPQYCELPLTLQHTFWTPNSNQTTVVSFVYPALFNVHPLRNLKVLLKVVQFMIECPLRKATATGGWGASSLLCAANFG